MSRPVIYPAHCAHPGCLNTHPSGKWGNIRAHADGWFASKDGTEYCPDHVPEWVKKWRKE